MPSEVTPAVTRALAAAVARAGNPDDTRSVPAALMLEALLEDDEGAAADLVRRAGGDPATLRLAAAVLAGSQSPLNVGDMLAAARRLAREDAVGSPAVLLAILRGDPGLAAAFESAGGDLPTLEAEAFGPPTADIELPEPLDLSPVTQELDTARVLDAAANRAREALRVVEDHCRFVLDDAGLTRHAKEIRHGLAAALEILPAGLLAAARDTLGDVGTTISTDRESARHTLAEVAIANLKRLQEALRSLEEYGKRFSAGLGAAVEALRYRSYTLERAVLVGVEARRRLAHTRLCLLVSGAGCVAALDWTIAEAAAGGAGMFQLREKGLTDRELLRRAREVRRWTRQAGVLFVVNDRPDIAALAEADGVHLGQDDLPVREARRIVGASMLVGVSTHDPEQVRRAVDEGASYLGVGPVFTSTTKSFDALAGLEFVRRAATETGLPWFAIGGITPANVAEVARAGAWRIAVGAAVCRADDPRSAAAALVAALPG